MTERGRTIARSLAELIAATPGFDPNALDVDVARDLITRMIEPVEALERVALRDALSRVLAADIESPIDVPAHDNSAMDGFAVRSADLKADSVTRLRVIGTALAGHPLAATPGAGEAVRIMTGAWMPAGTDTVVAQENTRFDDPFVCVPAAQRAGQHRRLRGEDLARGQAALRAGRVLSPADLGLLASIGVAEVPVHRRLRVAFFSSGDELRSIGETLGEGQIFDSNRYTIQAMLRRLGIEPIDMGVIADRPDAIERAVREAANCADVIISSGGVSVGEADYTKQVMAQLGEVGFWTIAMRPGRPMAFGRVGGAWYFGLPGNPVAVMIAFYFLARPALLRLSGACESPIPYARARSIAAISKRIGRTEYQRGRIGAGPDGQMEVALTGSQGSGVLRSMSEANCIIVLHHAQGPVRAGESVDCLLFDGLA